MRRRHLYPLLFALPALLAAGGLALIAFAATAGILWLFVFGDSPWPETATTLLGTVFFGAGLTLWLALLAAAYVFGKRQEAQPAFNRRHLLAAVGITALLALLALAQQWRVGNLGPPSAGVACASFCQARGFAGSSMPPRDAGAASCSCLDTQGRTTLTVPLSEVLAPR